MQWVKDLALSLQHCSEMGCCGGLGSVPGPGTSTCLLAQTKGKKKKKKWLLGIQTPGSWWGYFPNSFFLFQRQKP